MINIETIKKGKLYSKFISLRKAKGKMKNKLEYEIQNLKVKLYQTERMLELERRN